MCVCVCVCVHVSVCEFMHGLVKRNYTILFFSIYYVSCYTFSLNMCTLHLSHRHQYFRRMY